MANHGRSSGQRRVRKPGVERPAGPGPSEQAAATTVGRPSEEPLGAAPGERPDIAVAPRPSPAAITLVAWIVAIAAMVLWAPSVRNGFAWDDRQLIVENPALVEEGAFRRAWTQDFWEQGERAGRSDYYRPVVTATYIADRARHGLDPGGYHATNVALHGAVAGLFAVFLARLGLGAATTGLAALLFAVHPMAAESVAWVSGRTDVLGLLFVLAALVADGGAQSRRRALLAALWTFLACCSKEFGVVTPALLVLLDRRGGPLRSRVLHHLPAILAVALYFGLRYAALGHAAAAAVPSDLGWSTRIAALLHLPGLLVAPFLARVEYGSGLPPWPLIPGALAGLAVIGALLRLSARREAQDRQTATSLLVGAGLLALPAVAVVLLKGVVADRLLYAPGALLIAAFASLVPPRLGRIGTVGGAALVGVLAVATLVRIPLWRTERSLFEHAAEAPSPSPRVHLNLAIALHDEGILGRAWDELAIAMAGLQIESAWYTRALLHTEIGCYDLAVADYGRALAIDPSYHSAANNLGALLAEMGRPAAARRVLEAALARSRTRPRELLLNLDGLALDSGPDEEDAALDPALRCGGVEESRRRLVDARHLNRRALDRMRRQQHAQAGILVRGALDADPALVAAWLNLAQWFGLGGRFGEAVQAADRALSLSPNHEDAQKLRARLLAGATQGAAPGDWVVSGAEVRAATGSPFRPMRGPPPTPGAAPAPTSAVAPGDGNQ